MNKKKIVLLVVLIVVMVALLAGCVPGDGTNTAAKPANFFWGVWHGWVAPISFIIGLFDGGKTRIYEINNVGQWYDFGYYIAVISGFGGLALRRKRK
jgi:hypothetical protein